MELLHKIHADWCKTIIIVSHDMDEIAENCNRAAIFSEGSVLAVDAPSKLFKDADTLFEKGLDVPFTTKITRALLKLGIELNNDFTEENFINAVLAFVQTNRAGTSLTGGADNA